MRLVRTCLVLFLSALLLAACGTGGPRRNVFPPKASIQQLTVRPDGSWTLQVRLQNFSNVSMTFAKVSGSLAIGGSDAGRVELAPALRVGPESADVVDAPFRPSTAAAAAVANAGTANVSYKFTGRIVASDPSRDDAFEFEGRLSAVPGLSGVFR